MPHRVVVRCVREPIIFKSRAHSLLRRPPLPDNSPALYKAHSFSVHKNVNSNCCNRSVPGEQMIRCPREIPTCPRQAISERTTHFGFNTCTLLTDVELSQEQDFSASLIKRDLPWQRSLVAILEVPLRRKSFLHHTFPP